MNSATLNIVIALSVVAFPVAIIVWFIKYMASESEKRMTHMMERVGLDLVPASVNGSLKLTPFDLIPAVQN